MNRTEYYEAMKQLARDKRAEYGVATASLGLQQMRAIYKREGIRLDHWPHKLRRVRAAYFVIDGTSHVLLNGNMKPVEPRLFSLAHELKHHLRDQDRAASANGLGCREYANYSGVPLIEIGAEVFAAEFIFPEDEFHAWARQALGMQECTKQDVVRLKRDCPARISYTFIVKRLERLGFARTGAFAGVQFRKLEDSIYGIPYHRRRR